jgi:hypothetical protein
MKSRDKVELAARQLEKAINALGFAARIETVNNLEALGHAAGAWRRKRPPPDHQHHEPSGP